MMVPSTLFIFSTLLAVGFCSHHNADSRTLVSDSDDMQPITPGKTRPPHTHEEHPEDDDDHSDHLHPEELKESGEEDHEHPGHDHSASGHDHKDDHPEEEVKYAKEEEPNKLKVIRKDEDKVKTEE